MADKNQQAQQAQPGVVQNSIVQLPSLPGVRRDGTDTDADFFSDAQWCRFVRNRPRKMGGFQEISPFFSGPIHGGFVWSRQFMNILCAFSQWGVEYSLVDANGSGSTVQSITPAGYAANENNLWSYDYLFDAAAGSQATLLIAAPMHTLQNIDDPTLGQVYVTPLNSPAVMTPVADAKAKTSGGVFCTPPYTVLLGNDGNVTWSNANEPQNYTTGDAGTARVTGSKLVKGLPMRTGVSSGGLLWSLDAVLRMDWIGGSQIFKFSHISTKSSIMSQRSVIEYDGKWYWVAMDRFMVTNGVQVEELTNDMNLNWFMDNLNFAQRQKVFAMKVPRFGEIWWCFPFGDSDECNRAVIYNLRTKTWYDTEINRAWGFSSGMFRYPVMMDNVANDSVSAVFSLSTGSLNQGDYIRGGTSGGEVVIALVSGTGPYNILCTKVNDKTLLNGEPYTNLTAAGTGVVSSVRDLYSAHAHERGTDAVVGQNVTAIPAWFTTCDFGIPTGGPQQNAQTGQDLYTRIKRVEPDFIMKNDMTVQLLSRRFAQNANEEGKVYTFGPTTGKIDMREQAREFRLRFMSNSQGGFFEGGKTLVHLEPGDVRP